MRVAVVLLAWQRPLGTKNNLVNLNDQTVEGFHIVISNSNPKIHGRLEKYVEYFNNLDINLRLDSNDRLAFRRVTIARELAEQGFDVIMFLDDDITIPNNYIELALEQYEPYTYKSAYTWKFLDGGSDYYAKRERVFTDDPDIKYCGTGVSMLDARLFLFDEILTPPEGAVAVEDLWMSYVADAIAGYRLKYMDIPGIVIGGGDHVALYRAVARQPYTKKDLMIDLVKRGWKV